VPEGDALARAARRLQVLVGDRVEVEAVGKNLPLRFEEGVVLRRRRGRDRGHDPKSFRRDGVSRVELRQAAREPIARVAHVFTENLVFLPKGVADAVAEYRNTFNAISAPPEAESQYTRELVHAHDPQMELTTAFARVWAVLRQQLGTDPLNQQTLKLLGTPPLPAELAVRRER
jgi:hypothetical protein